MKRLKKKMRQALSLFLTILLIMNNVTPALAYLAEKNGLKTVAGNDGQLIFEEEDWITTFPKGIFALKDNTIHITEDGDEKKITVYRLGGREGEATASIALIPAVATVDEEGEYSNYANAAGAFDYKIRVEDPIGLDEDWDEEETATDSDAESATGSDAKKSKKKSKVTYTEVEPDEEDPYGTVFVDLEFADGEWVKDILISALDDEEHEPEEFLLVMIYDTVGAEFNDAANRATVCIADDEEVLDSEMGFEVESVRVDRAEGTAVLTLERTGGIQYVSSVDYYTEDGTALAGEDYVETSGNIGFINGFDTAEITVELIDDGIESADEEDDVVFYVHLENPKAGTIKDGADVLEVRLYNTNTAETRNLATMTYMPGVVDVSAEVPVSATPVADAAGNLNVTGEVVTEEKELTPASSVTAALGEAVNPGARTISYPSAIQFGKYAGTWKPYTLVSGANDDPGFYDDAHGYNSGSALLGQGKTGSPWYWRYGSTVGTDQDKERTFLKRSPLDQWYMETDNTIQARVEIDRLYEMYNWMDYRMEFESDGNDGKRNVVYSYIGKEPSSNAGEYSDSYGDDEDGAKEYLDDQLGANAVVFTRGGNKSANNPSRLSKAFQLGSVYGADNTKTVDDQIDLRTAVNNNILDYSQLNDYNYINFMVETSADRDIFGMIIAKKISLHRSTFNNHPVLTIHTADDQMLTDLKTNGSEAEQKAATALINEKLAPSVSLSDGGTDQYGLLYIGSQLYVRENALSGTYRFHDKIRIVNTSDGNKVINSTLATEDEYGLSGGTIRLYNKDEDILTKPAHRLSVDVPLDRQQKVIFSYGNSVDTDNDGTKTTEEKANALADIQPKFANATMVLGTFNENLNDDSITHKYYEDKEYKVSDYFALNENSEQFTAQVLNNLKSINFNMDANDVILFNGRMYDGNEDIPITFAELELTTLEFQFYDHSCLDFIRDMKLNSIASVGLYVDYNQNGQLDIKMNPATGSYETVEVDGREDIYVQALVTDSYRASDLEPVVVDGEIYQQMVFIRYNMTPRSLRTPAGANGDETCLVIPNFTTIVTNEEENARQSKEMKGYRAIDGKTTMTQKVYGAEASVGFVAFPMGGDYSPAEYVSDGNGGYKVKWNPDWRGSLYKPFENPEAIKLDNSMAPVDGFEAASTVDEINAYLGAMHGNDTYALTIHYNNEIQDTRLGTFHVKPEMGSFTMDQDAMGELSVNNSGKDTGGASNLSESDPKIKLPNLKLGVGPANLIMDDDMVGFSIGVPLYSKKTTTQYVEKGNYLPNSVETPKIDRISTTKQGNTVTMSKEAINDYKNGTGLQDTDNLLDQMKNAAEKGADVSDQQEESGGGSAKTRAAAAQTTGTYGTNYVKPTGKTSQNGFNVALNMTFLWKYSNLTNKFEFNQAAILVAVGGSVKVTVYPEPIHIVYVFVAFGADVSVATGLEMVEYVKADGTRGSKVVFQGVSITPTVYIEAGGGVGVELANVELYLKFTISISASFGTPEADASFDKFVTTGAVGLRITLLFLNYQMDIVGYETGYDKNKGDGGWFFRWHALGDNFGGSTYSLRSREEIDEEYEANGIHILWPEDVEEKQNFYSAEENLPNPRVRAYQIPEVPFEVSGYNSAVSAYSLAENMDSGSTYELYTWEDSQGESHNYILYTIQKKKSDDNDNGMQNSTLVLSELVSASTATAGGTVNALGMAHPFDRSNTSEPYVVVDAVMNSDGSYMVDPTGDLDFSAYVDDNGKMSITWISYRADGILGDASASNAAAEMSCQTVVKSTVIDLADETAEEDRNVHVVYDWSQEQNAGYRFQPVSVDEKVSVFAEAVHYDEEELQELKDSYDEYFDTANNCDAEGATSGEGNPHAEENAQLNYDIDRVYGKYSALNIAVASDSNAESGAYTNYLVQFPADMQNAWEKNQTRIDSITMTPAKDGGYYLAYAVTGTVLNGESQEDMEKQMVKELFLQKLTIDADGKPVLGTPILLRVLVDNDKDSSRDGVYVNSALAESFENPYFTNLNFMRGALETNANGEPVVENFFLFGMNGNTYVLNEDGLNALLEGEGSASDAVIKPFFTIETFKNEDGEEVQEADVRSDVSIGADGDGNIAAVYTDTVPNTVNNALYIVKYDPTIQGWGAPVMLAMNHMQVYEDSVEQNWSHEKTREAYYTYDPYNGLYDAMNQFVFAAPSIALGRKSTGEENGDLLVVTRGTLTELTTATYTNIYDEEVTEIIPAMTNGYLNARTGYYAVAYGIGNQSISEATLSFDYHNFTEGAILTPNISFRNTGDTAIRGSEANPTTIQLKAAKVVTDADSGEKRTEGSVTTLMTWEVEEHILAGAEFATSIGIGDELPPTADALPAGIEEMTLYFTISEDSEYISSGGGTAFGWSSLNEGAEKEGISYYPVGSKAELSFGSLKVGAEGHTTIERVGRSGNQTVETYVNMTIYNTGSENAENLKVKVEYSNKKDASGSQIWEPIDTVVTGDELNAGEPWKLVMPNVVQSRSRMADGLLTLVKEDGTVLDSLEAGYAVDASGILKLPVEYYDENDSTKSMNLRFTLVTDSDEHTDNNNALYRSMEAVSLFDVPDSMNLTEGNAVDIPVNVRTTRQGLEPAVTVRELTGAGGEVTNPLLSSLLYDPDTKILTMVPGKLGSGIVRIADINTGSFTDINFIVNKEGVNIVTSNPSLTFHDSSLVAAGEKSWEDQEYYAALTDALPYHSDTTIGKDGSSFTFTTFADNIDLYFDGTVTVAIKGNDFGYLETEYTSDNFLNPVLVNFKNHELTECEVTVTVKGEDTEFDKYVEFYGPRGIDSDINLDDVIDQKKDTAKPIILYGKSIPADSSVEPDATLSFPVYFIDNSGIQSATVDGKAADRIFAGGKAAVKKLEIDGNTGYVLRVRDGAGNETSGNLGDATAIMWFGGDGTLTENSWPHYEAQVDTSDSANPKLAIAPIAGNQDQSTVTNVKVSRLELDDPKDIFEIPVAASADNAGGTGAGAEQGLTATGGSIALTENGLYLVIVTNEAGLSQTIPVWVTEVPAPELTAVIKRVSDADRLYYMVDCADGTNATFAIYGSDDDVLDLGNGSGSSQSGLDGLLFSVTDPVDGKNGYLNIPDERYGYYILRAIPEGGSEADAVISIYCDLAKLTEVTFNTADVVWRTAFAPDIMEYTIRVPLYDEGGNPYDISDTVIESFKTATQSSDANVTVVQAHESVNGATATITIEENGITNVYTFHFVTDDCSCTLTEVAIKNDLAQYIEEDQEQLVLDLDVQTERRACQVEDHNDKDLEYRFEILEGSEIASVDGTTMTVTDQGTVKICVTAYNSQTKPVTSEPVTFQIVKKCLVTVEEPVGGTVDVREAHLEKGDVFNAAASPAAGFEFLGWKADGAEGYISIEPELSLQIEKSLKLHAEFKDVELPIGEILIDSNAFRDFINTITFDLLFKERVEVTINASDNACVPEIEYYVQTLPVGTNEAEALTAEELKAVTWTKNDRFHIDPDLAVVVYARITDEAGNCIIINSEGMNLDATAPIIEIIGRDNANIVPYHMEIRVIEAGVGLQSVEYRLKDTDVWTVLELVEGIGEIQITEAGTYTLGIKANDKAGNETIYTEALVLSKKTGGGSSSGSHGTEKESVGRKRLYLPDGTVARNCWVYLNGIWYYAGADGHAKTGWFLDPANGYWYFLNEENGAMKTGWHWEKQDGYWYYLHPVNGEMLVGWQNINEKYYYLSPVAVEPTWYQENGQWKYSGVKARPYGSMYENEQTPDGAFVGTDGARVGR